MLRSSGKIPFTEYRLYIYIYIYMYIYIYIYIYNNGLMVYVTH